MSIMSKWKEWSQKLYDKFGSKLQGKYDDIKSWNCPELSTLCDKVWNFLDKETQKKVYDFIIYIVKKYGLDIGAKIIEGLISKLNIAVIPEEENTDNQ